MSSKTRANYSHLKRKQAAQNFAQKNLITLSDALEFMVETAAFAEKPSRESALRLFKGDREFVDIIFEGGDISPKLGPRWKRFWKAVKECWDAFWTGFEEGFDP